MISEEKAIQTVKNAVKKNEQLESQNNRPLLKSLQQTLFFNKLHTAIRQENAIQALRTGLTHN